MKSSENITEILKLWNEGDKAAIDELIPIVYEELRKIARRYLRREQHNHTLQATALVNEAYIHISKGQQITWQNRAHFIAIMARIMRNILINHAMANKTEKRGGTIRLRTDEMLGLPEKKDLDIIALNDALNALAAIDERKSKMIELHFFGGLSLEEVAEVLGLSPSTVKRDWRLARAWLVKNMEKD